MSLFKDKYARKEINTLNAVFHVEQEIRRNNAVFDSDDRIRLRERISKIEDKINGLLADKIDYGIPAMRAEDV